MDQIAVAQALMNNTSVSEENRQIFKRRGGYGAGSGKQSLPANAGRAFYRPMRN